jgi:hypothetical protein
MKLFFSGAVQIPLADIDSAIQAAIKVILTKQPAGVIKIDRHVL